MDNIHFVDIYRIENRKSKAYEAVTLNDEWSLVLKNPVQLSSNITTCPIKRVWSNPIQIHYRATSMPSRSGSAEIFLQSVSS